MKVLRIVAIACALALPLAGCENEVEDEQEELRAELAEQQEEQMENEREALEDMAEGAGEASSALRGENRVVQEFRGMQSEEAVEEQLEDEAETRRN